MRQRRALGLAFTAAALACAVSVFAQPKPPAPPSGIPGARPPVAAPAGGAPAVQRGADDTVTLNFVNADIQAVIKAVADITGRNILIDPRVTGTVNIVAPRPISRGMVFQILLSALRAQGFAAVGGESGIVRIVPEAEAKFFPSVGDARTARGDQVVTRVFKLEYESAQQMVPILRPLVSPNNVINAFPTTNTLIITDYAENLRRIERVIASVDQPHPGEIVSIKLENANALDVAQTVSRLIPEAAAPVAPGATPKLAVTVDSRSNTLLVRADNPTLAQRIRELARNMDTPGTSAGNIRVVYLKNAESTKIAEALRAILTGQSAQRQNQPTTGFGGAPTGLGAPGAPGQPPQQAGQAGLSSPVQFGTTFNQPGVGAGAQQLGVTAGGATVQAYPETNSLVIIAPDHIYNQLRAVIDKLDARRAQIYVEALIVEVTSSKAAEFGIQWQHLTGGSTGGTSILGGTNFNVTPGSNIIQGAQNPASLGPGLNIGVVRGSVTIGGVQFLNLGALARALEVDSNANILSTPTILTLDNEEAKIVVGQNIPIITGSFTPTQSGTAGTNPFQTFDRRDIGLTLRVKPQVAEGGSVKLQIFQEVSSIFDRTNATGIITNKRAIESTVIVDDSQIIVLGGLISDDVQNTQQGVPVLSSIPLIGGLFRYENRRRDKTNLMVFLRPFVMRDSDSTGAFTDERYNYIRGVQAVEPPRRVMLPDQPAPDLPGLYSRDARARGLPQRPAPTPPNEVDLRERRSAAPAEAPVTLAPAASEPALSAVPPGAPAPAGAPQPPAASGQAPAIAPRATTSSLAPATPIETAPFAPPEPMLAAPAASSAAIPASPGPASAADAAGAPRVPMIPSVPGTPIVPGTTGAPVATPAAPAAPMVTFASPSSVSTSRPAAARTETELPRNVFLPRDPVTGQVDTTALAPEPAPKPAAKPAPARKPAAKAPAKPAAKR